MQDANALFRAVTHAKATWRYQAVCKHTSVMLRRGLRAVAAQIPATRCTLSRHVFASTCQQSQWIRKPPFLKPQMLTMSILTSDMLCGSEPANLSLDFQRDRFGSGGVEKVDLENLHSKEPRQQRALAAKNFTAKNSYSKLWQCKSVIFTASACRFWRTSRTKCVLRDSGCSGLARWMEKVCGDVYPCFCFHHKHSCIDSRFCVLLFSIRHQPLCSRPLFSSLKSAKYLGPSLLNYSPILDVIFRLLPRFLCLSGSWPLLSFPQCKFQVCIKLARQLSCTDLNFTHFFKFLNWLSSLQLPTESFSSNAHSTTGHLIHLIFHALTSTGPPAYIFPRIYLGHTL